MEKMEQSYMSKVCDIPNSVDRSDIEYFKLLVEQSDNIHIKMKYLSQLNDVIESYNSTREEDDKIKIEIQVD